MYELEIEGTNDSVMRAPDPVGTPLEVARVLITGTMGFRDEDLPDSTPVVLYNSEIVERQQGRRRVKSQVKIEVARFTLGELRKDQDPLKGLMYP
jgi:hypothetical protein